MNFTERVRELGHELLPPAAVKMGRKVARKLLAPKEAALNQELARLRKLPNRQLAVTHIFERPFTIFDGKSFAHLYELFFRRKFYNFECSTESPYIIDCGANIGVSVTWWKVKYPRARVVAFEPDPQIFRLLQMNCGHLDGVELVNAAVWSEEGEIAFAATGGEGGHVAELSGDSDSVIRIPCVRLESFLAGKCDLLKMDIEGAEVEVIRDSVAVLKNAERAFIEYHSLRDRPQYLGETISRLEAAGFRLYAHTELASENPFDQLVVFNNKDLRLDLFCYREATGPRMVEWSGTNNGAALLN